MIKWIVCTLAICFFVLAVNAVRRPPVAPTLEERLAKERADCGLFVVRLQYKKYADMTPNDLERLKACNALPQ
jgi:hypothetical protein